MNASTAPVLEVKLLTRLFTRGDEQIPALDALSFTVEEPQVLVIVGASGSGKSTLFNLLARFDYPNHGQILLRGMDLATVKESALDHFRNRYLGFVFQRFHLIDVLTALENVELALLPQHLNKHTRRAHATAMLARVGMAHRLHHKPAELSGGQQQRVAIARALVVSPSLVLADEPTGNLDSKTGEDILGLIQDLHRELKTTFIIATHDMKVMSAAQTIIRLVDGRRVQ